MIEYSNGNIVLSNHIKTHGGWVAKVKFLRKIVRQYLAPKKTTGRLLDEFTLLTEVHLEIVTFNLLFLTEAFFHNFDLITLADSSHHFSTVNSLVTYCFSTFT